MGFSMFSVIFSNFTVILSLPVLFRRITWTVTMISDETPV